jgi:hypothetical protein
VAPASRKPISKTLDDAADFLTEERGYEKYSAAICWAIWKQISTRRITLKRHWIKWNLEGTKWKETSEVANLSQFRSNFCPLEFDRRGYLKFVGVWSNYRYTIVEPCDFREIWPLSEKHKRYATDGDLVIEGVKGIESDTWANPSQAAEALADRAKGQSHQSTVDRLRKKISKKRRAALDNLDILDD